MTTVYLAGPISGLTYEESSGWRNNASFWLNKIGVKTLNPLLPSDINFVNDETGKFCDGKGLAEEISSSFFNRDILWVHQSDVVLADFTLIPENGVSGGTIYELGYAGALGKVCIVVGPKENIPLFCFKGATLHFTYLNDAIKFIAQTYTSGGNDE